MDERFKKINKLLSQYSLGQFDKRLSISKRLDEVDAFISGVNMLGEELRSITISKNYFTNIFNSVSDMVFILDKKGLIENLNKSAMDQLECRATSIVGNLIDNIQREGEKPLFKELMLLLKKNTIGASMETVFSSVKKRLIPVNLNVAYLLDEIGNKKGILLTAKDITLKVRTENLIIRAIIDTQEKERKRLAQDLHDSLGQQLSAIKFFISSIANAIENEEEKKILYKSNLALTDVIKDMRNICYNLMPNILQEFGLKEAIKEICNRTSYDNKIVCEIQNIESLPRLLPEIEIDIYRVIQEFINNSLKHANASKISIIFGKDANNIKITLIDNGDGFITSNSNIGMGLKNVQSRVKSHNGEIVIKSEIGKGTQYLLIISLIN
ncbi:MAG: hypothetical protein NVS9B7_29930 [Flavisolibacter sp.]